MTYVPIHGHSHGEGWDIGMDSPHGLIFVGKLVFHAGVDSGRPGGRGSRPTIGRNHNVLI